MPRFTSLSSVIANQIAKTVPNTKMPEGSAANVFTAEPSGIFVLGTDLAIWFAMTEDKDVNLGIY